MLATSAGASDVGAAVDDEPAAVVFGAVEPDPAVVSGGCVT